MSLFRRGAQSAALVLSVALAGCSGSNSPTPTAPETPVPATPAPSATPRAFACPLPPLEDKHIPCPKLNPVYQEEVLGAIDDVINSRPGLFDFSDNLGAGSWKVRDRTAYLKAVSDAINARGLCTAISPEEIGVKRTNDFNEQWNVITGRDYVRRSYITTCIPAAF